MVDPPCNLPDAFLFFADSGRPIANGLYNI
jgi:hypothetical protein